MMERDNKTYVRGQNIYLHYFMWYYSNKIDIDELCLRVRKIDAIINPDSKYYQKKDLSKYMYKLK